MLSVLFLIPSLNRGGAENVLVDLVNHMDQTKFQITVQTLFDKNSQRNRLRDGIEYRTFLYHQFHGNSRLLSIIPARLLYRVIVRRRYDVVVSYLEGPTTHLLLGCPKGTKTIAWIHSALETEKGLSAGFRSKKAALRAYQSFDKVVFIAQTVKQRIEETAGFPLSNGCVLYNTINTENIRNQAMKPTSDIQFTGAECNLISVGKIDPVKGYDRLAVVQKRLAEAGYKTHVYLLGKGEDQDRIEAYTKKQRISDTFTFLGFHDNPYPFVSNADLFVCSSRREGFSTAVSEALVLGIPVVSTNCSGAYELLGRDNEYGIVTENNEDALYEGIRQLLDDPALLAHYREKAAERGRCFHTENTVKAVEDTLTNLYND